MAARRARPRASEHRLVHVLLLTARVVIHNVAHEISTGHVPVEVVRRAALHNGLDGA